MSKLAFTVDVWIEAEPELVYSYFTDPEKLARWLSKRNTLDVTPGGNYQIVARNNQIATGEYQIIEPPNRLQFSWGWSESETMPPGSTTVEINFESEKGGTRLILNHRDLPSSDQASKHQEGWDRYLKDLSELKF